MKIKPEIIFECADYIVINKPAHLLSVPDRYDLTIPNMQHLLQRKYAKVYPVHRLDRQTSGIMVFPLTEEFFRHLSILFEKRKLEKNYQAIVQGIPVEKSGVIDQPILAMPGKNKMVISQRGKPSITHYEVAETFRAYSFLNLKIESGRTHQIRVHLESIGHPLLVDITYSGLDAFYLSSIKYKYRGDRGEERPLLKRTPLHANRIRFATLDGSEVEYEAAVPKDMRATLQQMRKQLQKI